jgi:basic membrane lipoprotein Med (substrate-binding protein (PBP1-ABC) superfamily)
MIKICECGKEYNSSRRSEHKKTIYHYKWIKEDYKRELEEWKQKIIQREIELNNNLSPFKPI